MKSLNEYPTPITDESYHEAHDFQASEYVVPLSTARDIERKLAACREFIRYSIDYSHVEEMHKPSAEELLAATAP